MDFLDVDALSDSFINEMNKQHLSLEQMGAVADEIKRQIALMIAEQDY